MTTITSLPLGDNWIVYGCTDIGQEYYQYLLTPDQAQQECAILFVEDNLDNMFYNSFNDKPEPAIDAYRVI